MSSITNSWLIALLNTRLVSYNYPNTILTLLVVVILLVLDLLVHLLIHLYSLLLRLLYPLLYEYLRGRVLEAGHHSTTCSLIY